MATLPHQELFARHSFQVEISGIGPVGYFLVCHGLSVEFEVLSYAEGGNNQQVHQLPGRLTYPPLVLTKGMTSDKALAKWLEETRTQANLQEITVTLLIEGGTEERKWSFVDAFPVKWSGPTLDTGSGDIATEELTIVHGGLKDG
jgi:phage tail-like protein